MRQYRIFNQKKTSPADLHGCRAPRLRVDFMRRPDGALFRPGTFAARLHFRMPLLSSEPDGVCGSRLHETQPSIQSIPPLLTPKQLLSRGIEPRYSGFRVQGAANSPLGAAKLIILIWTGMSREIETAQSPQNNKPIPFAFCTVCSSRAKEIPRPCGRGIDSH